jgi:hypothetical protein
MAERTRDISFHGEVWTDGRGQATVNVPVDAYPPRASLDYTLAAIDADSAVRVIAQLRHGRFSIESDQPHVKVARRIAPAAATKTKGASQ